jgi:enamine deaminase RidA (YjgF/YER057c/UK114 family)
MRLSRILASLNRSMEIVRGPAPGPGRSAWVKYNGMVWTVGVPKGKSSDDASIGEQTKITLASIDERLAQAGTDKTKIIEATVFLTDMSDFKGFDAEWQAWLPEGIGASRATVGVNQLANNDKVEIKVTVAA